MQGNIKKAFESLWKTGGFTYNLTTGELNPSTGYSVSLAGHEVQIELNKPISQIEESIRDYIRQNWQVLFGDDNAQYYVGGWVHNGTIFLDITEIIQDEKTAISEGLKRGQIAIFDNHAGVEIILQSHE